MWENRIMLVSFVLNCIIVLMVIFAFFAMVLDWNFMGKKGDFESPGLSAFRYFTVDSNILMGICSLIMAIAEIPVLQGKTTSLPSWVYSLKLVGTAAVMLTFVITACFLTLQFEEPIVLFYNSNLFLHLIVPLTAAISFVFTEPAGLSFGWTFLGILPTILYGIYYTVQVLTHLDRGKPDKKYDFYNFLNGDVKRTTAAVIAVMTVSYLLSVLLWWGNMGMA